MICRITDENCALRSEVEAASTRAQAIVLKKRTRGARRLHSRVPGGADKLGTSEPARIRERMWAISQRPLRG